MEAFKEFPERGHRFLCRRARAILRLRRVECVLGFTARQKTEFGVLPPLAVFVPVNVEYIARKVKNPEAVEKPGYYGRSI